MQIDMPKKVESIIETLSSHGYEAYAVGGCVRDTILGRTPDDWDITTSARPEEVKKNIWKNGRYRAGTRHSDGYDRKRRL